MTKILTIVVLIVIVFISPGCKKSNSTPGGYYLIMDIDNKKYSFSDSLFAINTAPVSIYASGKTTGQLELLFSDYNPGLYVVSFDTSAKKIIYEFTVNAIVNYGNSNEWDLQLLRPGPAITNPISLTITNSNTTFIEGSFSGTLINNTGGTSNITNGAFKVPFR